MRLAPAWTLIPGPMPMDGASPVVNQQSSAESKIHLFRSLFRGRDDVYPRRL